MITPLRRFYRTGSHGKLELFGIDGMEHAVISAAVMLTVVGITSWIVPAFTVWASGITWIVMRLVWFFIEQNQERAMNRGVSLWKYWTWSQARTDDMMLPLVMDSGIFLTVALAHS